MSVLFYNDQTLNDVMESLLGFEKASSLNALNSCIEKFQRPAMMLDARYLIACGILSIMIENCGSHVKVCLPVDMMAQIEKIACSIVPSPRWRAIGIAFWKWLDEFDLKKARIQDFQLINDFEELYLGIVAFTLMETREKKRINHSFAKFAESYGVKNYDDFSTAANALIDVEIRFEKKPALYNERNMSKFLSILGFQPRTLILGEGQLNNLDLRKLHQLLVPIFFGGKRKATVGVQWQPLSIFNLPTRLCFTLPLAKKNIIQGAYKGVIFEDYLCNVLTGRLAIANDIDDPFGGYTANVDGIEKAVPGGEELIARLNKYSEATVWQTSIPFRYYLSEPKLTPREKKSLNVFKFFIYKYRVPLGRQTCNIIVRKETHPSFKQFLQNERTHEWEEDILLLHYEKPKHCLIGQAKFTIRYNSRAYLKGANRVRRFAEYVERNSSAKSEIGIPLDFSVIPVLFTSFTGPINRSNDDVLKTTIFPILQGKFLNRVSTVLSNSAGG